MTNINSVTRARNREKRRDEIVRAMLRVMSRRGYAGASVAQIAGEAGLTPGLVHYHFPNKRAVLLALIDQIDRVYRKRYEARLAVARTERARLFALTDAWLEVGPDANSAAVACWVALGTEALVDATVRQAYAKVVDELLERLTRHTALALSEAGRPVDNARTIAAGLLATVEGAYRLATLAPGTIAEGTAAQTVRAMAEGLIDSSVGPVRGGTERDKSE